MTIREYRHCVLLGYYVDPRWLATHWVNQLFFKGLFHFVSRRRTQVPRGNASFGKLSVSCIAASAFLTLFPPLQSYLPQPEEFHIGLVEVIFVSTLIFLMTAASFAVCTLLLGRISSRIAKNFCSVLITLTLVVFIQQYFFNWRYPPLGTRDVNWSSYSYGWFDTPVWILLLTIGWLYREVLFTVYPRIAASLFLYASLILGFTYIEQKGHHNYKHEMRRQDNVQLRNTFSTDKNVIVVVLDEFQGNIFQELIDENKELGSEFAGFTYFRNSTGRHAFTKQSVPNILSGDSWDGVTPWEDFSQQMVNKKFMPRDLKKNGYLVDYYLYSPSVFRVDDTMADLVPTHKSAPVQWLLSKFRTMAYVYDFSLFRMVPHYLKKYVMNNLDWVFSSQFVRFSLNLDRIKKYVRIQDEQDLRTLSRSNRIEDFYFFANLEYSTQLTNKKVFKYLHLEGAHYPYVIKNNFEINRDPVEPAFINGSLSPKGDEKWAMKNNYKGQAHAYLKLVGKTLFAKIKAAGLWDNPMIFVISDHGLGVEGLEVKPSGRFPYPLEKAKGIPLFLLKPWGAHHALKISEAPVSLGDIPKTIFHALGVPSTGYDGMDVLSIRENMPRKRYFTAVNVLENEGPRKLSMFGNFPIYEYEINGSSWDDRSWKVTKIIR